MNALLLSANLDQAQTLSEALELSGFVVVVVTNSLYALTHLERVKPDVVVVGSLDDSSVVDFFDIVRSDSNLNLVPVVLISDQPIAVTSELDAVIPSNTAASEVVRLSYKLVLELTRRTYVADPSNRITTSGIQGQLGEIGVFELAQWLSRSNKTGRMVVAWGSDTALWFFNRGNLIHAEYKQKVGEAAVLDMMIRAEKERGGAFVFEPSSGNDIAQPTIHKTTDQLLLSLAVELDHIVSGGQR